MLLGVKYGCESRKEFVKVLQVCASGGVEAIADPWLGDDVAGVFGGFDLLAELAYVDAEVFGLIGVGAPYGMQEGAMGEDLSGVLSEDDEEVELLGCEVGFLAADEDFVLRNVDDEVAHGDDLLGLGGGGGAAAELGADAGLQFLDAEGLGDVVVGAGVERGYFDGFLIANGEDDDGRCAGGADLVAELDAAHLVHGEVGDDDVGVPLAEGDEAVEAVERCADGVSLGGECGLENADDLRFIVDDEDLCRLVVVLHSRSECWVTMWTSTLGASRRKC